MGSTFYSVHYHIVYSTKERRPFIRAEWRPRLHSYLGGIIRGMSGVSEIVGGVDDHVHLLVSLKPAHRISDVLRDLKKDSTNWVRNYFDGQFTWQEGYAVFTVSPSNLKWVRNYIANQKSHHASRPYVEELKGLLGRASIQYDEKYLL